MAEQWFFDMPFHMRSRCAQKISEYLESNDDYDFNGNLLHTGVYIAILKKTIRHLAKQIHKCSCCQNYKLKWKVVKCEGKEPQALFPLCSCDASTNKGPRAVSELKFSPTTAFECDDIDVDPELQTSSDIENARTEDIDDIDFDFDVDNVETDIEEEEEKCSNAVQVKEEVDETTNKSEIEAPSVKRGRGRPKGSTKKRKIETKRPKTKVAIPRNKTRNQRRSCPKEDDFESIKTNDKDDLSGSSVNDLSIEPKELIEDDDFMDFLRESHVQKSTINKRNSSHKGTILKKWKDEDLHEAINLVRDGMSVNKAAENCSVPKSTLARHWQKTMQDVPSAFSCSFCEVILKSERSLKAHEMSHTGEYPYLCDICGKGFSEETRCDDHVRRIHLEADKSYNCPKCDAVFQQHYLLCRHFRTHSNLPNMCRKCGESFKTVQELNTHRQTEHYSHYSHQCSQCGCKFKDVSRLMNHVRQSHSDERPFICSICSKGFASSKCLRNHVQNQHGKLHYFLLELQQCPHCCKMYKKSTIRNHINSVHSEIKPIKCPYCIKQFAQKKNFDRHVIIHTGERPYLCIHCGSTFQQSTQVRAHHNKHHPELEYQLHYVKQMMNEQVTSLPQSALKLKQQLMNVKCTSLTQSESTTHDVSASL